jgi:predicted nucleotidyltransferase component of viral defense system
MLHLETVEPRTFALLEELLGLPELRDFSIVGGTCLSLLYGHRISVDLDLFSNVKYDRDHVLEALKEKFKTDLLVEQKPVYFGIFCYIRDIKVEIVKHPFSLISPPVCIDKIRMFSPEDIMAMKVQAVLGRAKKKDFWDIAELLQHYTVADFVRYHAQKYSTQNLLISVPQAMTYFSDADEDEDPISLKGQTWQSVQAFINQKVRAYLKE